MSKPQYGGPWKRIRQEILERDGYVCQIRGQRCTVTAEHVDHIVPVYLGGPWYDHGNLRAACARCNTSRSYKARTNAKASRTW